MKPAYQPDLLDAAITAAMTTRPAGIFTFVIRRIVDEEHNYPGITLATIRRRLERMERAGTATCRRHGPGCHNEWRAA